MFRRKSAPRAQAATDRASEPAKPRILLPLTRAVWRWFKAPVAMLVAMSAADAVKFLPDDESAPEGAASGTCSDGGKGMPPSGPFSKQALFWAGEIIGAASLFILLFLLLFIGSAIQ